MVGKGAWCLRFSTNGKSLAVACPYPALLGSASIRIYSVETGQMEVELPGIDKVQLFWEGHKNLHNLPHGFDDY